MKNLRSKIAGYVEIEYQGKRWNSKTVKGNTLIYNEIASFEFIDLHQKSIVPVRVMDKCVGKDRMIGIAAIPLAGVVAGVEMIKTFKLEKCPQGDVELSSKQILFPYFVFNSELY